MGSNATASANYSVALGGATVSGRGAIVTGNGSVAIGTISSASAASAVALGMGSVANRDNTVSVGAGVPNIDGSTFTRQIVNVAAGTEDNDAVNVGQMNAGLSTTNASIAATNAALSTTNASLSTTNANLSTTNTTLAATNATLSTTNASLSTANTQITALNGDMTVAKTGISTNTADITKLNDKLGELSSGTIGLVQQAGAGSDLTVGANTDGAAVNFASNTSNRRLSGIADGTLDSDAVNVGQMNAGLSTTNAAITSLDSRVMTNEGAITAIDGRVTNNETAITDLGSRMTSNETAITNLDGRVTNTETSITHLDGRTTANEGAITKLADQIGSGTLGLVQQANAGDDLTVGANTDGAAVNFASKTSNRKLTGIEAGSDDTDAVNVGQMNAGLATTNAAIASTNAALSTTNTQVAALDGDMTIAKGNIATHTTEIKSINDQLSELSGGTIGLVQQSASGADLTVGANTDGAAVNFASNTSNRRLTGVADGTLDSDAVNFGQMNAGLSTTNAAITGLDGRVSTNETAITNLDGRVTNIDNRVTVNEGDIKKLTDEIGSGTLGLVQQASAGDDITVGAATGGTAVNFAGSAGNRKLTGIGAGDVSATSTEAINGSQLHGVADSVASAIGGGATVKADGSISAPSFTVGDGSGGTKIVNSVGDVVTNLDGRVTTNEGDIKKLADDIGSGTLGLVQQANPSGDITVGANSDGHAVNFSSKTGARTLTGVAAGDVSASSTDAVNGSQLHGVSDSVAAAIGGGATVKADGSISAPSFTVGDGNGGTKIVNSVGDVVTNLDSRTTANEGDIKKLADDIGSGTLGLVQQANPSGDITVGANSDGHAVNFSSKTGARTLTGVAAGDVSAASADAVNGGQLHGVSNSVASALGGTSTVGADGKLANVSFDINGTKYSTVEQAIQAAAAFGATDPLSVRYDLNGDGTPNFGSVTLGGIGAAPVVLTNVADGVNRYDAVNFGQLSALNDKFSDLDGRVGSLEQNAGGNGPGTPGDGSGTPGTGGPGSLVVGDGADASGANSSAIGQGAVASGENGTALGQGSAASGSNSSAVGQGAVASGENSTSLGQGASATASGSVAIGQGSVATEANTVSFGNGTEEGNRRLVNIADGINASDAATKGQLDRAMESVDARFNDTNRAINDVAKNAYAGIAAAMAMPNMTPSAPGKTVVAVGTANFKSGSAIAAGATYRSRNGKWLVNGAASLTSVGDAGVRAQVGYEF
nr:YadA-like family protein [Burkholderia cenocepacia]